MANSDLMIRAYDAINAGDLDAFGDLIADDLVEHDPIVPTPDKAGVLHFFAMLRAAFPDTRFQLLHTIGEDDLVAAHCLMEGTHEGEFMGIPATGRRVSVPVVDIVRFRDGLAVEHWGVTDSGAMMQQLGVAPGPPG